tara:strand:+ start:107 stop:469 length:363 start_codon:yes stop_codon:yes gene_type:complete
MSFLLLSVVGITLATAQETGVKGKMVDAETGEVILIFPTKKLTLNQQIDKNKYVFGSDEKSEIEKFENTYKDEMSGPSTKTETKVISCGDNGSCDGGVILEKSTAANEKNTEIEEKSPQY